MASDDTMSAAILPLKSRPVVSWSGGRPPMYRGALRTKADSAWLSVEGRGKATLVVVYCNALWKPYLCDTIDGK